MRSVSTKKGRVAAAALLFVIYSSGALAAVRTPIESEIVVADRIDRAERWFERIGSRLRHVVVKILDELSVPKG